jgi:hypothetical protein
VELWLDLVVVPEEEVGRSSREGATVTADQVAEAGWEMGVGQVAEAG